jgi:DNA-binding MarR family transcriptional regulator
MYNDLDPLLHSQLRLAIVSMLLTSEKIEFTHIKEETKAAAGNISLQIKKLQEAGYINVEKTFKNNYPKTMLSITEKGVKAFESYVNELKKYINPVK